MRAPADDKQTDILHSDEEAHDILSGDEPSVQKWSAHTDALTNDVERTEILDADGSPLTFADVARLLETDRSFAAVFNKALASSSFEHFFFECPALTKSTAQARAY